MGTRQRFHGLGSFLARNIVDKGEPSVIAVKLLGQPYLFELTKGTKQSQQFLSIGLERYIAYHQFGRLFLAIRYTRGRLLARLLGGLQLQLVPGQHFALQLFHGLGCRFRRGKFDKSKTHGNRFLVLDDFPRHPFGRRHFGRDPYSSHVCDGRKEGSQFLFSSGKI